MWLETERKVLSTTRTVIGTLVVLSITPALLVLRLLFPDAAEAGFNKWEAVKNADDRK